LYFSIVCDRRPCTLPMRANGEDFGNSTSILTLLDTYLISITKFGDPAFPFRISVVWDKKRLIKFGYSEKYRIFIDVRQVLTLILACTTLCYMQETFWKRLFFIVYSLAYRCIKSLCIELIMCLYMNTFYVYTYKS